MLAIDRDGVILDVNDAMCDLVQYPWSSLLGRTIFEITDPGDVEVTAEVFRSVSPESDWRVAYDEHLLRSDGVAVSVRISATWTTVFGCVVENVTDLSELSVARTELANLRTRQAALLQYSSSLIFVIGRDGRFSDINPATERLFGSHVGEDATEILRDRIHPDDLAMVLDALHVATLQHGENDPVTFRARTNDGRWIHLETIANNQFNDPAIEGLIVNGRDVTDRETHAEQIEDNLKALLATLGRASEIRDPYTSGHQQRVGNLASAIATRLRLPPNQIEGIRLAAQVHDIGKLAIPAEILAYPGTISPEVFTLVKRHCQIGHDILADIAFPWPIAETVLQHHERLDGSGYPKGLTGKDILLEARVVAVADVAEAMTSHRPYRPALRLEDALEELRQGRGTKYDPAAVNAYLAIAKRGPQPGRSVVDPRKRPPPSAARVPVAQRPRSPAPVRRLPPASRTPPANHRLAGTG